jgi:hypothetical protein
MFLLVGLPGAGKTTRARALEGIYRALRFSPDEWMIPLFGESDAGGKRDIIEGRLIWVALRSSFQVPTDAESAETFHPHPPVGYGAWSDWASARWPSLPPLNDLRIRPSAL